MEHQLQQPWPSELNSARQGHGLELKDKLTVRYANDARHNNDVGAIQANHPVPSNCTVYYYELTVLDQGTCGRIAVGFSDRSFKLTRQPGWEVGSYGYHGDDGKKFIGSGMGEDYGPTFGAGDTVGAGIHLGRQELFFTKNGTKLKVACRPVKTGLYPTIGLHSKGETVQVNFGQKPWVFDLEGMLAEEKAAQRAAVDRILVGPGTTHKLVRQYLLHYGYEETLRAFDEAAGLAGEAASGAGSMAALAAAAPASESDDASALPQRASLRRSLMTGDVDGALVLLAAHFPAVLADPGRFGDVHFRLTCQSYIELVRCGHVEEAVVFARATLAQLRGHTAAHLETSLRDLMALAAYQHPESSPVAHLMGQAQRDAVADAVNAAVLVVVSEADASSKGTSSSGGLEPEAGSEEAAGSSSGSEGPEAGGLEGGGSAGLGGGGGGGPGAAVLLRPALGVSEQAAAARPVSRVETLLHQLVTVQGVLHETNGGQGGVFSLQEYMVGPPT